MILVILNLVLTKEPIDRADLIGTNQITKNIKTISSIWIKVYITQMVISNPNTN